MDQSGALTSALRSPDLRLKAVLDNASAAIFLMDDRQRCIYMNSAAENLTGFTLAEVQAIGKPLHDIVHHTHPDGRPFPIEDCAIDRAFPEHNQTRGEEIFVHRNGSFYPVAFTASAIRDEGANTIGTIVEVRDIREEKRAAELQRLLVHELNHRVKNTLATVQALAWQSFRNVDPEAVRRFEGRLHALSNAHDVLTSTAWHEALMGDIVNMAIRPFGQERYTVSGPNCKIPPKAAVTMMMVLHELTTNAVKYGALSVAEGHVTIRWTCQHHEDETELDLVWQEQGGPPVTPPPKMGFGTRFIQRQLKLEFDGEVKLDFAETGLICRLRLRFRSVADPIAYDAQREGAG